LKLIINDRISKEAFDKMKDSKDKEILLDISSMMYLTSKEISQLLSFYGKGFHIKLLNANDHIIKTLEVLNLQDAIETVSE
jgi:hypothetical protein